MQQFATIISPEYFPFASTLYGSIRKYHPAASIHILVTGDVKPHQLEDGMHIYLTSELSSPIVEDIQNKYKGFNDHLRWSLKPVFLLHLLNKIDKLIYLDADVFFFGNAGFLFDELDLHSILLTPHFAQPDPFVNEEKFMMNFGAGLFNAGFIGVNRKAVKTLEWWTRACLYHISDDPNNGYYVDQRYLDMIPVIDAGASIVRHQGCNLGSWNMDTYKREKQVDGTVLINGKFPVIFIHFNHETMKHILNGDDAGLKTYWDEYAATFAATGHQLENFIPMLGKWKSTSLFLEIKRAASIRSRFKQLLFRLAKKL